MKIVPLFSLALTSLFFNSCGSSTSNLESPLNIDDVNIRDGLNKDLLPGNFRNLTNKLDRMETSTSIVELYSTAQLNTTEFEELEANFKKLYPLDVWKAHGWFEDGYLRIINSHWLKFPPTSKTTHYTLAFLYLIIAFCGFFGNILVIFMFLKCQSLRTPANYLIFNLALSDFLMVSEIPFFIYNSIYLGPALGQTVCTVYGFIGGITGTVAIGTLTAIAFDRYSVVVYPLEPLRSMTKWRAKVSAIFAWLYGGFFAIIPALNVGMGKYVPEGLLTSCSYDYLSDERDAKIFIFAFFIAAWLLPLIIIIFCYVNIVKIVIKTRNLSKKTTGNLSSRHCKEDEKRKTELRLAGVVIAVIALFFIAWTPYSIVSLLGIFGYKEFIYPMSSMLPAIFAKIASCIDPFVYMVSHPKFRQELENLFLSKSEQRRRSTMRHGWSVDKHQRETSEDDVEIVEMDGGSVVEEVKVRFKTMSDNSPPKIGLGLSTVQPAPDEINTLSSSLHNKSVALDSLPKTLEENKMLKPPSWVPKPEFANQRGNSIRKVVQTLNRMKSQDSLPA